MDPRSHHVAAAIFPPAHRPRRRTAPHPLPGSPRGPPAARSVPLRSAPPPAAAPLGPTRACGEEPAALPHACASPAQRSPRALPAPLPNGRPARPTNGRQLHPRQLDGKPSAARTVRWELGGCGAGGPTHGAGGGRGRGRRPGPAESGVGCWSGGRRARADRRRGWSRLGRFPGLSEAIERHPQGKTGSGIHGKGAAVGPQTTAVLFGRPRR